MADLSVLIGGRAGDGINSAGLLVSHLFNRMGYYTYMYFDYPSLIKGGHNFTITRAADHPVGAFRERCDVILALNQDSIDLHRDLMDNATMVIYDSNRAAAEGQGVPIQDILKEEQAPGVMGNSCIIGAFCGAAGIPFPVLEEVFRRQIPKGLEKNLAIARRGFDAVKPGGTLEHGKNEPLPLLSGNEAIGIGLLHGGLDAFVAYPMTPTSNLLHFLAGVAEEYPLTVVHPENEIAVILMAHGLAYAGKKAAVGTSGGGFCLMTESFSMAGMNEVPVVVVMGQRTGPSTGLPTYTGQTDLHFMLHAGQGEFPRLVVAPGDTSQACSWSSLALSLAGSARYRR
jgi:2-oxoglutarate ferredoxin oxidoreductase subunit alpha